MANIQTDGTNEELKDDDRSHDGQPAMHEKSMADDVKMTDAKAPVPGVKVCAPKLSLLACHDSFIGQACERGRQEF